MLKRMMTTAAIAISMSGCGLLTGPEFPNSELTQFVPSAKYLLWWEVVEQCSGRTGRLADISWYRTIDGERIRVEGEVYDGYWWEHGNRIAVKSIDDGQMVRHEMLHALLREDGHRLEYFADRCSGAVLFDGPEGYGAPIAEKLVAQTIKADSALNVQVTLYPAQQSITKYSGALAFVVTATNALARPVWVPLAYYEAGISYDGSGFGWSSSTFAARVLFRAHQSRSVIVDGFIIDTGRVNITALYGTAFSPSTPIVIRP